MSRQATLLKEAELLIAEEIRQFGIRHADLFRRSCGLPPECDVTGVVYSSIFGHTLDYLGQVLGKEKLLSMAETVLDHIATTRATVKQAESQGIALDPHTVALALMDSKPS